MIRHVTQGVLVGFLLFFYTAILQAEVPVNHPIQLTIETDRNQVYQDTQLIVTLHIFHDEALPESVDIIPPELEHGRVRTLGLPHTRVEPGLDQPSFHTTQQFALFPAQAGSLEGRGPSLRFPSPFNNSTETLTTELNGITVATRPEGQAWLPSENLVLSDRVHPITDGGHIRQISLFSMGSLPHQLPQQLINTTDRQDYQLIERNIDEFQSRQGVSSHLQELWYIHPTPNASISQPISHVVWWDTEAEAFRETQLPAPSLRTTNDEPSSPELDLQQPAVSSTPETNTDAPTENSRWTDFWIQVAIGFTLLTVVSLAILAGFKFQSGRSVAKLSTPKNPTGSQTSVPRNDARRHSPPAQLNRDTRHLGQQAELLAFQELTRACQENACYEARMALVYWAACFWPEKRITQPESIFQANVSQTLNYLLLDLEHHIKQSQQSEWRGDLLLEAVRTLRRRR